MYGSLYTDDNVLLSGIHTHSGPGGYFQYVLFEITSLGFVKENLDVVVNGIVKSISLGEATRCSTLGGIHVYSRTHTLIVHMWSRSFTTTGKEYLLGDTNHVSHTVVDSVWSYELA